MLAPAHPDDLLMPLRQTLGRRLGNPTRSTLVWWAARGLKTCDGTIVKLGAVQVGRRWLTTRRNAEEFAVKVMAGTLSAVDGDRIDVAATK
jgi:hypothetical protein